MAIILTTNRDGTVKRTKKNVGLVYPKTKGICIYCGERGPWDFEHVIPRSQGGTSDLENIWPACKPCNRAKNQKNPEEYRQYLIVAAREQIDGLVRLIDLMGVNPEERQPWIDVLQNLRKEISYYNITFYLDTLGVYYDGTEQG